MDVMKPNQPDLSASVQNRPAIAEKHAESGQNSLLRSGRLSALMIHYCIPCIISLLVGALYNIVDQIFISNAPGLGSYGNAANTVVFPLTVIALAVAVMIGDVACALISLCLEKQEQKKADRAFGNALSLAAGSGLLITLLYWIFFDGLLSMFGGAVNEQTWMYSREYFAWINAGMLFYVFGQAINPVIRADGSPKFAMACTLCGALINCVLDPLFIFGFGWGLKGAAIATILGQIATAALSLWYVCHPRVLHASGRDFLPDAGTDLRIASLGLCSFLSQISLVCAMAAINNMLVKYAALDPVFSQPEYAQIPMAVVGIVMKFFQIVISISIGFAAGSIPIVSYNMGAGLYRRVRKLFLMILGSELILGFAALFIVEGFPSQLIALFGAGQESVYYAQFAVKSFRIYLCLLPLACLNKGVFIFLQAMGKAAASTFLSMVRELVLGVGFALLLPRWFGLDGILYSMPVSDALTAVCSVVIIAFTLRMLSRESAAKPVLQRAG